MKCCTKCRETKPEREFRWDKTKLRYLAYCLLCEAEMKKRYREANKERIAEWNRQWQLANPDLTKAAQQRWREKNPGVAKERARVWYEANRAAAQAANRKRDAALKAKVYAAYGGFSCACCGETEPKFLSIDHVDNDGAKHRRDDGVNGKKLYAWLVRHRYPKRFQVLCMNCNFGKARNQGLCPHHSPDGSTTTESTLRSGSK